MLMVNQWKTWNPNEQNVFLAAAIYCGIVAVAALLAILTKEGPYIRREIL